MNEKQSNWLKCYVDSGNGRQCVAEHYPDVSTENQASKASQLKRKLQSDIVNSLQGKLATDAPKMLNVLKDIGLNTSGAVRPSEQLKAASEWLSRAGLDAAQVVEIKDTATHEQLLERLKLAMTGLPEDLISQVLPPHLIKQMDKDNEKQHSQKTH